MALSSPRTRRAGPSPTPAAGVTPEAPPRSRPRWGVVLLLGCPLIVLGNFWVVWMERVAQEPYLTTISLFWRCFRE